MRGPRVSAANACGGVGAQNQADPAVCVLGARAAAAAFGRLVRESSAGWGYGLTLAPFCSKPGSNFSRAESSLLSPFARSVRLCSLFLSCAIGCDRSPPEVGPPPASPPATTAAAPGAAPSPSASVEPEPLVLGQGDAKIPFEFPEVATPAAKGDYVLAPPRAWIDAGLEKDPDKQTYIYYGGWMQRPGPAASEVETLAKSVSVIPNALIIAIPRGQTAAPGEVVLTTWASGTGMQRALVVEGGSRESPSVRYLDMSLDNPSGWGKRPDTLAPNTFKKLTTPGEVGTTAACKEGAHRMRYIVTASQGGRLLGYGFAGKIAAFTQSDCTFLPLKPRLEKDDVVFVPVVGRYTKAKVLRVEPHLGRVWARYKTEQDDQVIAVALLDAARDLD